ncbi:MAG: HAMP domain-containing sensor histidine kinase, partial [Pseudomonadota bacterium]
TIWSRPLVPNTAFHGIFGTDETIVHPEIHARDVVRLCQSLTVETETWNRVTGFITSEDTRVPWSERLTLGSKRALRLRLAPLPGGDTMLLVADITDSERFAEALSERNSALESAEEMRTAVLDQISHRLRTPLNTIFGFGQLLNDPRFGQLTERQREYAAGILEASGQLLDIIDEVTDLASLQPGDRPEDLDAPTLDETLDLTRALVQKRAGEAGVSLETEFTGGHRRVECEPSMLRQIAFNLAASAVQRARPGGRVRLVSAPAGEDRIAISVIEEPLSGEEAGGGEAGASAALPVHLAAFADGAHGTRATTATLAVTQRMVEDQGGDFIVGPAARPNGAHPAGMTNGHDAAPANGHAAGANGSDGAPTGEEPRRTTVIFPLTPEGMLEPPEPRVLQS